MCHKIPEKMCEDFKYNLGNKIINNNKLLVKIFTTSVNKIYNVNQFINWNLKLSLILDFKKNK